MFTTRGFLYHIQETNLTEFVVMKYLGFFCPVAGATSTYISIMSAIPNSAVGQVGDLE